MGNGLGEIAEHHAARTGLDHAPARLLAHMARVAYDDDNPKGIPPRRYWLSRAEMAFRLGVLDMPAQKPGASAPAEVRARWTAGNSRVNRALKDLEEVGAVRRVSAGRPGFNAEFEITVSIVDPALLDPLISPQAESDAHPLQTADRSPRGTAHQSPRGPVTGPGRDRSPVPLTRAPLTTDTAAEHHLPTRPPEREAGPVNNRACSEVS